ncbi:MAG: putative ABC exporter domain-containing protein, partial [Candidatus Cloacimonetes bacterium]|nr:putative ABC exporter domain-containing protein [Candidatus Cloacimonadota bacterium]
MKTTKLLTYKFLVTLKNLVLNSFSTKTSGITTTIVSLYFIFFPVSIGIALRQIDFRQLNPELASTQAIDFTFAIVMPIVLFLLWLILLMASLATPLNIQNGDFSRLFTSPINLKKIVLYQMIRNSILICFLTAIVLHIVVPKLYFNNIIVLYGTIYNLLIFSSVLNFFVFFLILRYKLKALFQIVFWILTSSYLFTLFLTIFKPDLIGFSVRDFFAMRFWNWVPILNLYRNGLMVIFKESNFSYLFLLLSQFGCNVMLGFFVYLLANNNMYEDFGKSWVRIRKYQDNMKEMNSIWSFSRKKVGYIKPRYGTGCFTWKRILHLRRTSFSNFLSFRLLAYILIAVVVRYDTDESLFFAVIAVAFATIESQQMMIQFGEFSKPYIYYFPGTLSQKYWAIHARHIYEFYLHLS